MKYFLRHNSHNTITGTYNGAKFYAFPHRDNPCDSKEQAEALKNDFNSTSPEFEAEVIEVEE